MAKPTLIKKYGNRRLYDTGESRYLTLEELSVKIQSGVDVRVVEVKTGEDLTQATLTQIVIESRGAARFLPVSLLTQMIRMGDDALGEFLGQYVTTTMEVYLRTLRGMQMVSPFSGLPLGNPIREGLGRLFGVGPSGSWQRQPPDKSSPEPMANGEASEIDSSEVQPSSGDAEIADLRAEIEALRQEVRKAHPPHEAVKRASKSKPKRVSKTRKSS